MKNLKITKRRISEALWGWLFILPTIGGLIILNIYPIAATVRQSFFKTGDFGRGDQFVCLKNYVKMFSNADIWQAFFNTLKYAVVEVPISIAISLVLAVFLNSKIKFRSMYRTIFFLPMVCAPAAIALVWRWLFNTEFGLINNLINAKINWISSPKLAIYSIALIGIWSIIGYNIVLFIAGLQEVPRDYYEAAAIDGAGGIRQFFSITVPLISPTIFFVCVTRIIGAMQVFDLIYMMTDVNNPALKKTQSLVYLFYKSAFIEKDRGYGAAIVVFLMGVIMIITFLQMKAQKKWVHYSS